MKRNTSETFIVERHYIADKEAEVVRTRTSGKVYHFRMWVAKEKCYVRKSLRTKDLHIALELAKKEFYKTIGIIESGKTVKDITVGDLVNKFLEDKEKDYSLGYITKKRVITLRSYLKNFIRFIGNNTSVGSLNSQSCYDYAEWRKNLNSRSSDDTIKMEKVSIISLIKYANKHKYSTLDTFDFRKVGSNKGNNSRGTFNDEEYNRIIIFLRGWTAKKNNNDEKLRLRRMMFRDMFFTATNTYLRLGELINLKWGDIIGYENIIDNIGHHHTLATIRVRKEISKVRKERIITTRGGNFLRRWFKHTKNDKEDDFIFIRKDGKGKVSYADLYSAWYEIMKGANIKHKERKISWYSCRHYGITARLKAGANVFNLAKIAGTSIEQIENFYGKWDQTMSRETSMLNYKINNKIETFRDI